MATTTRQIRESAATQATTRRNEIIALVLFVIGLLFALCLFSYNPNDASVNAANTARAEPDNLIGAFGANVASLLTQFFGLVAYPLPLVLMVAAWQQFLTRRIAAHFTRIAGMSLVLVAAVGLLEIFITEPIFDRSFEAGGVIGVVIVNLLSTIVGTVGATIVLLALLAVGFLLMTNFSFTYFYERIAANNFSFSSLTGLPQRFLAWYGARHANAQERAEQRRLARAEQFAASDTPHKESAKTGAERVAEFMRETSTIDAAPAVVKSSGSPASAAIKRHAVVASNASTDSSINIDSDSLPSAPSVIKINTAPHAESTSLIDDASFTPSQIKVKPTSATTPFTMRDDAASLLPLSASNEEIEEMMRSAAVVRVESSDAITDPDEPFATPPPAIMPEPLEAIDYKIPDTEFLHSTPPRHEQADDELIELATRVAEKCAEFNVSGKIEHICPGPVVTTYEFKPNAGVKYSRVTGLVDDLCLALKAESVRIDRIPGKAHVGIEVPNPRRETIYLREVIESRAFTESPSKLTLALGKTIDGLNYVADLAKMPHLLIAGATGTGKSVCLNSLIVSILYKATPDEVKFIMVDPKRLELGLYADIPHLATPIITEPKRASNALKWAVSEMEKRYKDLAKWSVRNIDGYNAEVWRRNLVKDYDDEGKPYKTLPFLVIIIDELADLMMVSGHEVEESITRLAQMARAVGIHLVLATQRPSVDVITGLIKANFPSRISFRVSSKVDSRTILDSNGSEGLLGRGDMLFLPPGTSRLVRVHGAYLDETEVGKIVTHIKAQGRPIYDETITLSEEEANKDSNGAGGDHDELFDQALRICVEMKRASTSVLQRRLRIGYGRAAAILDAMERDGFIGAADGARPRAVLGRGYETVNHWDAVEQGVSE